MDHLEARSRPVVLSMFGLASGGIKALIGGFKALTLAIAANPIGLLITAVTVAAVAVYKYWDHIL